jgi:hypothetical protein
MVRHKLLPASSLHWWDSANLDGMPNAIEINVADRAARHAREFNKRCGF